MGNYFNIARRFFVELLRVHLDIAPVVDPTQLWQRHLAQVVANKRVARKKLAHASLACAAAPNQVITEQQGIHYGTLPPCSEH